MTRLDEVAYAEMWDAVHALRPDITREEFDRMYEKFEAEKKARSECGGTC